MNKILVDTNILLYAIDSSSIFHQRSREILEDNASLLFTTSKNISEYFAVCAKLGLEETMVWGFYEDLKANVTFLFPDEASLLVLETLLQQYRPKGNRVYDVEIVSVMLANDIRKIATFNVDDFKAIIEVEIIN